MKLFLLRILLGLCFCSSFRLASCHFLRLSTYRNILSPLGSYYRKLKEMTSFEKGPSTNTTSWNVKINSGFGATPVITSNGTVVAVSLDGRAFGLTELSGEIMWTTPTLGQYIVSSPTLSDDESFVYFTAMSTSDTSVAEVYSLDARTGDIHFRQSLALAGGGPTTVYSSPVTYNQSRAMFVAAGDSFYAIQLQATRDRNNNNSLVHSPGDVLWKYSVPFNKLLSSAVVLDKHMFFTTANRRDITCLNADTGEECWREDLGHYSSSTPVLDRAGHDCMYVASSDGVHAVSVSPGCDSQDVQNRKMQGNYTNLVSRLLWSYSNVSVGVTSVIVSTDSSALYFGSMDNRIIAINITRTFETPGPLHVPIVQWEYSINGNVRLSAPVVDANDHVYVTTDAGTVYAFDGKYDAAKPSTQDANDKLLLWELTPQPVSPIFASPCLSNGTLFLANSAGNLVAITSSNAEPVVPIPSPVAIREPRPWTAGEIAGWTVAVIILVMLLVLLACIVVNRMKGKKSKGTAAFQTSPPPPATSGASTAAPVPATAARNPISIADEKDASVDSSISASAPSVENYDARSGSAEPSAVHYEAYTQYTILQLAQLQSASMIASNNTTAGTIVAPRIPSMVGDDDAAAAGAAAGAGSDDETMYTLNTTQAEYGGDDESVFTTESLPFPGAGASSGAAGGSRSELQSPFDLKRPGYMFPINTTTAAPLPKQLVFRASGSNNTLSSKETVRVTALSQLSARKGAAKMSLHVGSSEATGRAHGELSRPPPPPLSSKSILNTPLHSPPAAPSTMYTPQHPPPPVPVPEPPPPLTPAVSVLTEDQWSPSKSSYLEAGTYHHPQRISSAQRQGLRRQEVLLPRSQTRRNELSLDIAESSCADVSQPSAQELQKEGGFEEDFQGESDSPIGNISAAHSGTGGGYNAEAEQEGELVRNRGSRVGFPRSAHVQKKRARFQPMQHTSTDSESVEPPHAAFIHKLPSTHVATEVDSSASIGSTATTEEPLSKMYVHQHIAAMQKDPIEQMRLAGHKSTEGKEEENDDEDEAYNDYPSQQAQVKSSSEYQGRPALPDSATMPDSSDDESNHVHKIMYG